MKKRVVAILAILVQGLAAFSQSSGLYTVKAPDANTVFETKVDEAGSLRYRVLFHKDVVVAWSSLGIQLNEGLPGKLSVVNQVNSKNREVIPWVFGERDSVINHYNAGVFSLTDGAVSYQLEVRVFDGSVAFRYIQQERGRIHQFKKELTAFSFPQPFTIYQYNQESVFTPLVIDSMKKTCDFPATLTNNKLYVSIGEAANDFFTKAELNAVAGKHTLQVSYTRDKDVYAAPDRLTPWRTISVASSAVGLHRFSDLNYRLSPPAEPAGGVLRPGKLIRSVLTTQAGIACIDFAAKHHYQYIMYDAGWYGAEFKSFSDPTQPIAAIDMQKVIDYGKAKGIGVILYVNYVGLRAKLDTILPLYKQWGVAGMKFGFVDGLKQDGIRWLQQAIEKVNRYGFILNIHDNYKPTGLSRTYPALLTQEGIRGDENSPDAFHNTSLPFTRFLAGAGDFTFCFPNPKAGFGKNIKVSKAQQLALPVVYYSPLQSMLWYGKPEDYTNEDEIAFYDEVPVVWNESVCLAGNIGRNACVARRNGMDWYVGIIAGDEDWSMNIKTDFLQEGKTYEATIYEDAADSKIGKRVVTIRRGQVLSVSISAKGGQAIIIRPRRVISFSHPGVLHNTSDLSAIKQVVGQEREPGYGSFGKLQAQNTASASYQMKGPYEILGRDGDYAHTKNGFEQDFIAAYHNALMWTITGKDAHAKKAVEIINAYSRKVKGIGGSNDNALAAATVFILVNAAEIIRYTYPGWSKQDIAACENTMRNVYVKELDVFFRRPAYTNGNWGAACTKAMMSLGVFLNDTTLFNSAVGFYYSVGKDNGSIADYIINPEGQCQESGRDQPHVMFGLGCMAEACEVGYKQGLDMYAALDNRLMAGYEYMAKYNLGYDVPYRQWKDITGKYSGWKEISTKGRGEFRPVFEIVYNAYVIRKNLKMPFVTEVLQQLRPEGVPFKGDNAGYGTLLFHRN